MKEFSLPYSVDAAVITSPTSCFYITGVDNPDAMLVITKTERYYVTDARYALHIKQSLSKPYVGVVLPQDEQFAFIAGKLQCAKTLGLEYGDITLALYNRIIAGQSVQTVDITPDIMRMRLVKSHDELSIIAEAEAIVDKAFTAVLPTVKCGITERQLARSVENAMFDFGADGVAFDTIVAFGENGAKPHAIPSDRVLAEGDVVVMDFGAKYRGYCSDFTRTLFCGVPDQTFKHRYNAVAEAQRAAFDYFESGGRNAKQADAVARNVLDGYGYAGQFTHSLGHGVGLQIHESPYLSAKSTDVIADGEVFSVEPGVYFDGLYGIRIESLCAIINGKFTVLDRSDKQLITV